MYTLIAVAGGRPAAVTTVRTQDMCRTTPPVARSTTEPTAAILARTPTHPTTRRPRTTESKKFETRTKVVSNS